MKRIIAGPNAVTEALTSPGADSSISVVYLAQGLAGATFKRIDKLCSKMNVRSDVVPRESMDTLSGGLNHQGVMAITGSYTYLDLDGLLKSISDIVDPVIVVLDQIQDPGNLGAIVRSTHALGGAGLILTRDRSAAVTPAAVRASAGACELTGIARVTNLARCLEQLRDHGFRVLGAAGKTGTDIDHIDWSGPIAIVLGNEGRGLRRLTQENCDELFSIPLHSGFDSLNVSSAAAISLFTALRSRSS